MPDLPPLGPDALAAAREAAKRRGRQLRARRRLGASGAVVAAVLVAAGVVASGQEDVDEIHTVGSGPTTSTTSTPTFTIDTAPVEPVAPSPTVGPTTTRSGRSGTTTTTSRRTSQTTPPATEPPPERRCATVTGEGGNVMPGWEEYWATQPQPNDPLTLKMCVDDVTPAVGQVVTATLTASDPDAPIPDHVCGLGVLWEDSWVSLCRDVVPAPPPSPAPTPPQQPGERTKSLTHKYEGAGSRTVTGLAYSGEAKSPYESSARVRITVNVH